MWFVMDKQRGENYQIVISEAQLRQRIALLGRQISQDFQGRELLCVGVLENGFAFVADLVRQLTCSVRCQWVTPRMHEIFDHNIATTEIFYTPEIDVAGHHVLLCEGILSTGQTTDFLFRTFQARGAASISVCSLLDRPSDRRVDLHVAYYGFRVGPQWLAGFGLGAPALDRNLPFIFAPPRVQA
jgi:hypoxanthine phosphoribosyltransferase